MQCSSVLYKNLGFNVFRFMIWPIESRRDAHHGDMQNPLCDLACYLYKLNATVITLTKPEDCLQNPVYDLACRHIRNSRDGFSLFEIWPITALSQQWFFLSFLRFGPLMRKTTWLQIPIYDLACGSSNLYLGPLIKREVTYGFRVMLDIHTLTHNPVTRVMKQWSYHTFAVHTMLR